MKQLELAFLLICTQIAFITPAFASNPEISGEPQSKTFTARKDVLGLKDKGQASLDHAFEYLQGQVDSINFDSQAVKNWIESVDVPNFPLIDEEETIEDLAALVARLIEKAEVALKENITEALATTKTALSTSFNAAIAGLLPQGTFSADAAWEKYCCDTTGFWSSPDVTKKGITSKTGTAAFKAEVEIGGSVGVEATTKATMEFSLSLTLEHTGWANARFWPAPTGSGDDSNHKGCSVTVRAKPLWKASYSASAGGGVMLTVTLGSGQALENVPALNEVEAKLTIVEED